MARIIVIILIMSSFFISQATLAAAEEVRNRCIELFVEQCNTKCLSANGVDCSQNCQENAENQCREAGE